MLDLLTILVSYSSKARNEDKGKPSGSSKAKAVPPYDHFILFHVIVEG